MRTFGKPMLPRGILHELVELRAGPGRYDPESGVTYTVTGDLDHGAIHPLRRFVVERKGEAAPK